MDLLACGLDDELTSRLQTLESDRGKINDAGFDPTMWEVEVAYVRRELQIRRARRELHDQYMNSMREQERAFIAEEASLPVVDFDNFKQNARESFNKYE